MDRVKGAAATQLQGIDVMQEYQFDSARASKFSWEARNFLISNCLLKKFKAS